MWLLGWLRENGASNRHCQGCAHLKCDRCERSRDAPSAPFVFTGVQLLHPRLFTGAPEGPFSLTRLYDEAEAAGRLCGVVHDGAWHHIGTPAGLAEAEQLVGASQTAGDESDGG